MQGFSPKKCKDCETTNRLGLPKQGLSNKSNIDKPKTKNRYAKIHIPVLITKDNLSRFQGYAQERLAALEHELEHEPELVSGPEPGQELVKAPEQLVS